MVAYNFNVNFEVIFLMLQFSSYYYNLVNCFRIGSRLLKVKIEIGSSNNVREHFPVHLQQKSLLLFFLALVPLGCTERYCEALSCGSIS